MRRAHKLGGMAALAVAAMLFGVSCSTAPKDQPVFDTRNKAAEYSKLADGLMARSVWDQAVNYYRQSLEANSSVDNIEGVARSHVSLGRAWLAGGDMEEAERQFRLGLDYARMAGSKSAEALATAGLGEVAYARGDKEGALASFAAAILLAADDNAVLAVALHDSATAKASLGRGEEARADLEKAASINAKAGRWGEVGANRYVLASIFSKAGDFDDALAQARLALAADKRVENGPGIAQDLAAMATILAKMGRKDEAWDWWRRAFDTALVADMPGSVRKALESLVSLGRELGKDSDAERYATLLARLDAATSPKDAGSRESAPADGTRGGAPGGSGK
jgi:tetratricopeptide (TPR) repeat protein